MRISALIMALVDVYYNCRGVSSHVAVISCPVSIIPDLVPVTVMAVVDRVIMIVITVILVVPVG
jgi:hypothetical protein